MQKAPSIEAEFENAINIDKEREYWLELSELQIAKVIRYLLEFTREDYPNWDIIKKYLEEMLDDTQKIAKDDIEYNYGKQNHLWYV